MEVPLANSEGLSLPVFVATAACDPPEGQSLTRAPIRTDWQGLVMTAVGVRMESESFCLGATLHWCDTDYTGSLGRLCALLQGLLSYILLFPFAVHEVGWRNP